MGKKTVEDSRRFEKDRRDKLNVAFEELGKLLPDHDPSVTLSKIEILRKAAQYIKQLQDQNDEIMKFGSDSVLSSESEKLRKRVTHLLIKTKELVEALRSAGVPIPTNKKKRKRKLVQSNPCNQNIRGPDKETDLQPSNEDGQTLQKVKCGCMKTSPERKPLKESNPIATTQPSSTGSTTVNTSGHSILNGSSVITLSPPLISAPIMATRIQSIPIIPNSAAPSSLISIPRKKVAHQKKKVAQKNSVNQNEISPEKETDVKSLNEVGQTLRRVKCGCMKTSPERKPLKESNPVATTQPTSAGSTTVSTSGHSILNGSNIIAVSPPLISAPIMATRIQSIPIVPNSPSSVNTNPTIIPSHIVPSLSSAVLEGCAFTGNRTTLTNNTGPLMATKISAPVSLASNFMKEIIVPSFNKKTINVVTTTSSSVITTQSIVNSTQLISLPQSNVISNPIVAPRIQNVPVIEKNILSNLGPGTLILADGRIMNVPPIVPQIVVKPQPAVILMPTAKKKEKLLIPKRREVTKTTFSNKAPIPAIQTFRLESCRRVRPKKKPKSTKPLEKTKKEGSKEPDQNKKRKLGEVSQNDSSVRMIVSEEILSKELVSRMTTSGKELLKDTACTSTDEKIVTTSVESGLVISLSSSVSSIDGSSAPSQADGNTNLPIPNSIISCLDEICTSKSVESSVTTTLSENTHCTTLLIKTIEQRVSEHTKQSVTLDSESNIPGNENFFHVSDESKNNPSLPGSSSASSVDSDKNLKGGMLSDKSGPLNQDKSGDHSSENSSALNNQSNSNPQSDFSSNCIKTMSSITPSNDILTNIPPCISSSTEQDSIFIPKDKQLLSTETTRSVLSEGSVVKQICSDVERSVNGSNKNLAEKERLNSNPQKNLDTPSSAQPSTSSSSKNLDFSESKCITDNTKPPEEESPVNASHKIDFINSSELRTLNDESRIKENSGNIVKSNSAKQDVHVNSQSSGSNAISESLNHQIINYPRSGPNPYQGSVCTNNVSTPQPFVNNGKTVFISQTISSQGKSFSHQGNPPCELGPHTPLNNAAYPNLSNGPVSQTGNNLPIVAVTSSQVSLTSHSSYEVPGIYSEKEFPFFSSNHSKPTDFKSNKKATTNCNNSGERLSSNVFPIYSSSTFCSNGTGPNSQSSFNLKPSENSGNVAPVAVGRNADVCTSFNQTPSTETIGGKPFYTQNVSFPQNSLPRSSNWEKAQCNKSLYGTTYGATSEEATPKTTALHRNKSGSFEKQAENVQLSYLGFQNEPVVTSQSNNFFNNVLPSSCGFNETPGVFSYHNTSTSVVSSYSFISHENISSLHKSSAGGMKNIHQDRVYFPEITSSEKSKGNSFRNNEKLSVGNISFYPGTSQALISSVYPNSSQSSLATVYSSFPQPNLSNVYSSSSQLNSNPYPNFTEQNSSTYPTSNNNKGVGVYTSSAHPVVSCAHNTFSQPTPSGVYTISSTSNTFIKSNQPTSSVTYPTPAQHNISNIKNSTHSYLNSSQHNSSIAYTNPPQSNIASAYISSAQASAYISYTSSTEPAYSTSVLHSPSSNPSGIQPRNYPSATQTNLFGVFPNSGAPDISSVYTAAPRTDNLAANAISSLPMSSNAFSSSSQATGTSNVNRSIMCSDVVNESPLYQSDAVSKPKQPPENNGSIPLNNYNGNSTNASSTNTENIQPASASSKTADIILPNNPATLNDISKSKESSSIPTTLPEPNLTNRRHSSKSMQTPYSHDKDVSRSKNTPTTNVAPLDQSPMDSERSAANITEKDPSSQITSSKSAEHTEKNRGSVLHKYNNYDFISNKGKDIQNKITESNVSLSKNNETVVKSIQSKTFVAGSNSEEKHLDIESNKLLSNSDKKSVSTEVIQNDINYSYNSQPSNNYSKPIQTSNTSFTAKQPISSALSKSYSNFNSSTCETLNNHFETTTNPRSVGVCSSLQTPQSNQPLPNGNTGPSPELLSKGGMMDVNHRAPEKQDKSIQKSYEPGSSNTHLKGDIPSDFLKSKDIERNTFIPIIDDVRLPTDFSSDLFSSLQVPTGGAHSESISPTAAFLLAFPLVSTSRNVENLHDNENHENQTSTPTTILQIGNIEPPSTELFHPVDFQKNNPKPSDHFDISSDYLHVNELNDKQNQNPYKRCEKRKETYTEYTKEVRPTDPKQKSKSIVVTTSTYTQSYTHPLLSCNEFQYCEKDSSQWQQEFPASIPKDQKKTCDRKKEKAIQKGCFHQTYPECYSYKEKKRKQQNRISVNWMTTPENREQAEYQNKEPELVSGAPAQLYGGISLDFPTEPFPDFCNSKKANNYSWSPNKTLLPALDNHLMIPSTLPTLVGDLALGTSTPSESYKSYDIPKSQGQMSKKVTEKLDVNKKQSDFSKNQANFFSVSQLVDPKSKKQKTNERNYKRPDKNSKPRNSFNCPKRKDDHCMYYEERNSFMPNQNQYNEKRHPYKGNYSAESLIGGQHNEIDFSSSFNYQQNTNYFQSEFPPTVESSGQQYGYFQQTHFAGFNHDECQEFGFNTSQRGLENNRQKSSGRKDENYQGTGLLQPQICPPCTKSINYLPSSHLNTNTTTTLTNFNLSTIFPEMNDQRVGTSIQPPQQMNTSYSNSQNYRSHIS